jgi:hypothetical protein
MGEKILAKLEVTYGTISTRERSIARDAVLMALDMYDDHRDGRFLTTHHTPDDEDTQFKR